MVETKEHQILQQPSISAMKKIIASAFLLCFLLFHGMHQGLAQSCCPYLDQIQLLPANPTDTHHVRLAVGITASSMGYFVSSNASFPTAGNIEADFCYFAGMLPSLQSYNDTVSLGILPAGTYQLLIRAYQTSDPANCSAGMMNDSILNFTVSTVTSHVSPKSGEDILPQKLISSEINWLFEKYAVQKIRVLNLSGQEEFVGYDPSSTMFSRGFHLIEFASESGQNGRILWLKP
jgi:hypothetical protein